LEQAKIIESNIDGYLCPCCEYRTISKSGGYEICIICGWEDDPVQSDNPNFSGGANKISLNEAKKAYKRFLLHACKICGYEYNKRSICPCCGAKLGIDDISTKSIHSFRQQWLNNGAKWFDKEEKKTNWSLKRQLEKINIKIKY
jgi:hypothetical protein